MCAEGKIKCMLIVAVLFPGLIKESYETPVSKLMKRLNHFKVPENLSGHSENENLWGYKYSYEK